MTPLRQRMLEDMQLRGVRLFSRSSRMVERNARDGAASVTVRTIAIVIGLLTSLIVGSRLTAQQSRIAYLAVDLRTNAPIATVRPDLLDAPILPGSIMKVATLAAALESGVINERTGLLCSREAVVAGHRLVCTHPDLHRSLRPAEALAHSCNVFFATVAARLPRTSLDRALVSLGLPPSDPSLPVAAAALGVEGIRASPRHLLDLMVRVTVDPSPLSWRASTLTVIREGLRGAAQYGTASALAAQGVDAMAKTGTTLAATGGSQGLVVGVTPALKPTIGFVLLASGGAGTDAAALAADRLRSQSPAPSATVRIGIARQDGGYTVRTMPLEEYVAGVLVGEAAPGSTPAALEALAVTIRTFTVANRGRHNADGFDLCDLTHCQVLRKPTPTAERAAAATAGRVLRYRGAVASVFYTASCGGHSERPSAVWPGAADPRFLPSRADDACGGDPAWMADLTVEDLSRALRAGGFKGESLRDVRVIGRTLSGRVAWLRLDGLTPNEISGEALRTLVGRTLGWQHIRSTAFDLRRTGSGFHVAGHGAGHGVGLCVVGSARLAARGESAGTILSRYFPGLQISTLDASLARKVPEVLVSLPAGDQGEHDVIYNLTARALDALVAKLGVVAPARLRLRFHPTVESYQRTTGQPWFTAGATRGTDVHLLPLSVLRMRGILERTIRHELIHILIEPALAGRPLWVSEGAASYFAGEVLSSDDTLPGGSDPGASSSCPIDRELRSPISQDALRIAYARAAACFARQIRTGKEWRDVF